MSSRATLLAMAMQLPRAERADLAKQLIASLDEPDEVMNGEVEAAWLAEVERRIEKIDHGTAKFEPWDVVRDRIAAKLQTTRQ